MNISLEGLSARDVKAVTHLVNRLHLLAELQKKPSTPVPSATKTEVFTADYRQLDALSKQRALTDAESKRLAFVLRTLEKMNKVPG